MAIYCQFLPLKNDEGTPNEKAADLFGNAELRDYCINHKCPNGGEIDDNDARKKGEHVSGGFIPSYCLKNMPEKIRAELCGCKKETEE